MNKKKKIMNTHDEKHYTKENWYNNTYSTLESNWLIESLKKLNLKQNFVFLNLSANAAYYEKDSYDFFKETHTPKFYVGDLFASRLTDDIIKTHDKFVYLNGDNNACDSDFCSKLEKADVILDSKGALWYALKQRKNLKELLMNYEQLLKDENSVLIFDSYSIPLWKKAKNHLIWSIRRYNKRKRRISVFGELSNYYYLCFVFGKKKIDAKIVPLNVNSDSPYANHLQKTMNTAYITKANLKQLVKDLDNVSEFKIAIKEIFSGFIYLAITAFIELICFVVGAFIILEVVLLIFFLLKIF